jgi:hypothetical protein
MPSMFAPGRVFVYLTPQFSCKHTIIIAAKPHPKSACLLQRSLDSTRGSVATGPYHRDNSSVNQKT